VGPFIKLCRSSLIQVTDVAYTTKGVMSNMTNDFYPWLKKTKITRRFFGLGLSLSTVVTVTKLATIRDHLPWKLSDYEYSPSAFIAIAEAVVLGVLGIFFLTDQHIFTNEKWCKEASRAIEKFRTIWQWLWIFWSFLYVLVAFTEIAKIVDSKWFDRYDVWFSLLIDTANNLNTVFLLACFVIMYEEAYSNNAEFQGNRVYKRLAPTVIFALLGFLGSEVFCAVFVDSEIERSLIRPLFAAVAGVAGAAALCLIVSRLESKFVSPPKRLILLLYCYAALQPLIAAWPMSETVEIVSLSLWFALKLVLFILVFWFLNSGRALFYFDRMQTLNKVVSEEWERFYIDYVKGDEDPTTPTRNDGKSFEWDVFLSGPMASLGGAGAPERAKFELHVNEIKVALESFNLRVYRAPSPPGDSLGDDALRTDSSAIRKSRFFLLLWYHSVPSSSLFECGVAYEKGIPTLILADELDRVPFLLRKFDKVDPRSHVIQVPVEQASQWLTQHWSAVEKRATKQSRAL